MRFGQWSSAKKRIERGGYVEIVYLMSEGGFSRTEAGAMTRAEAKDWCIALAIAKGNEINWRTGEILPPKEH